MRVKGCRVCLRIAVLDGPSRREPSSQEQEEETMESSSVGQMEPPEPPLVPPVPWAVTDPRLLQASRGGRRELPEKRLEPPELRAEASGAFWQGLVLPSGASACWRVCSPPQRNNTSNDNSWTLVVMLTSTVDEDAMRKSDWNDECGGGDR
mmetsp:Transcript_22951/g.63704  ORF Transcript_22951/g.63704 Transcript_22951/m.63704 type:complete len:151 (-) Transcript_22951:43-495(-)